MYVFMAINEKFLRHVISKVRQSEPIWKLEIGEEGRQILLEPAQMEQLLELFNQAQEETIQSHLSFIKQTKQQLIQLKEKFSLKDDFSYEEDLILLTFSVETKLKLHEFLEDLESSIYQKRRFKTFLIPGTEPVLQHPKFELVLPVKEKLEQKDRITEQEAETLMKWLIYCCRMSMDQVLQKKHDSSILVDSLEDFTEFALGTILYSMESIPSYASIIDGHDRLPLSSHNTMLLKLPVEKKRPRTLYLLDPTHRQFYLKQQPKSSEQNFPTIGSYLVQDQKQLALSKQILKKGYFNYTSENAKHYYDPFFLSKNADEYYDFQNNQLKKTIPYTGKDYIKQLKYAKNHLIMSKQLLEKYGFEYRFFDPDIAASLIEHGRQYQKKNE